MYALPGKRIWVAGHTGMVGGAVARRLEGEGCTLLTARRSELDLTRQADVEHFVRDNQPDAIVLAAARVGGILANDTHPVDFLFDNLVIETNIFGAAHASNAKQAHQQEHQYSHLRQQRGWPAVAVAPLRRQSAGMPHPRT